VGRLVPFLEGRQGHLLLLWSRSGRRSLGCESGSEGGRERDGEMEKEI
jgi:hypothetical protein